jgi:hypothetical protein
MRADPDLPYLLDQGKRIFDYNVSILQIIIYRFALSLGNQSIIQGAPDVPHLSSQTPLQTSPPPQILAAAPYRPLRRQCDALPHL